MRHKVYRSLDRSPALFGIEGSYLVIVLAGLGVAGFLSFILGSVTVNYVGMVVFFVLASLVYFGVLFLQERFTEKELKRYLSNFSLPGHLRVSPKRIKLDAVDGIEGPVE